MWLPPPAKAYNAVTPTGGQNCAHPPKMTHPITPPPELVQQWADMLATHTDTEVFSAAAQWGSDQELEACCDALDNLNDGFWSEKLRAARRPKPQSLKKLAMLQLDVLNADLFEQGLGRDLSQIRHALEQLDD